MSGKPVSDKDQVAPRALWSAHPPLWMMITFIVLMVTVWGHYVVIVYELFRLRKEEPHAPVNANIL
jgi:heme/copper-type cytochrome/quinol oxidase subunit 2